MARSTKQQTVSAPAARPSGTSRASKTTPKPRGNGAARPSNGNVTRTNDGAPGLGHPIFDALIAELGDPRRTA